VLLEAGTYRYRFLVDGEWRDDPNCKLRVPNPFGSQDAVLKVAASDDSKPIVPGIPRPPRSCDLAVAMN
jgi:hypothetical protein